LGDSPQLDFKGIKSNQNIRDFNVFTQGFIFEKRTKKSRGGAFRGGKNLEEKI